MKYKYLLTIRGNAWPEKINLAVYDREPSREEQLVVIREYWQQYEKGLYPKFEEFIDFLEKGHKHASTVFCLPYRLGIWTERIGYINQWRWW